MQKPHCAACSSMNASRTTLPMRSSARPSTVVTLWPATDQRGVSQDCTARPSTITVQAPQ